jgi:hypothetical protein
MSALITHDYAEQLLLSTTIRLFATFSSRFDHYRLPIDLKLTLSCKLGFCDEAGLRFTDTKGQHMDSLQALLIDGTRYDPRYLPSRNADHMPMTLCAISGLGGQLDALIAYRDQYKKILHEIPSVNASPVDKEIGVLSFRWLKICQSQIDRF